MVENRNAGTLGIGNNKRLFILAMVGSSSESTDLGDISGSSKGRMDPVTKDRIDLGRGR